MSTYAVPERAEVTFVAARHETGDELEALSEGCRVAVAEELRQQAEYYRHESKQEYQRASRLANSGQKWKHEAAVAASQTLKYAEKRLAARADALDPEGATR